MNFGTTEATKLLDDDGSKETTTENYRAGQVVRPIRKRYEIKTRVHNQKDEQQAYLEFSDELARDKSKLDPVFKIERSNIGDKNGYYYVVSCYSMLEY